MTITDEELLKLTSSLFTEQKGSSDLLPEPLQGNPQTTNCSDSRLPTTNCHSIAVLQKWGFISKEIHRQKDKDDSHMVENPPEERLNSRTHPPPILSLTPDHTRLSWYHHTSICPITDNSPQTKKGFTNFKWLTLNFQMKGTACQEHPGDSWGPTHSSCPSMAKEKPEQTHPKHRPHGTKGLIPQIFDIFPGKMITWEGRKLVFTRKLHPRRICPSPVAHKGFSTCLTFREDTGVGCQQIPDRE